VVRDPARAPRGPVLIASSTSTGRSSTPTAVREAEGGLHGIADDPSLRREGRKEERKGEAKDELGNAQQRVEDKAAEVSNLERKT
jgi:uncharacterized protein YjbJ (UPF0337 family)